MKSQTSATVSKWFNRQVGRTDGLKTGPLHPDQIALGRRLRRIELIKDAKELGEQLMEVWEDE